MATGGRSLVASVVKEELVDWRCGACEVKGLMREAKAYCKNCGWGLCASCLPVHNENNKTHSVLGTEEKAGWGKAELTQWTFPECSEHQGQFISMYCGRHDDMWCPVCVVFKHDDRCKPMMSYIPEIAKGIRNSQEFQDTVKTLDDLIVSLTKIEHEKSDFQKYLKAKQGESIENIEKCYADIIRRIEVLKEDSLARLKMIHTDIDNAIQDDIEQCRKTNKQLQDINERMQDNSQVNESLLFVTMKNSQSCFPTVKEISSTLHAKPKNTPRFEPNNSLNQAVKSANEIGKIFIESSVTSWKQSVATGEKKSTRGQKLNAEQKPGTSTESLPTYGPELARMMYNGARVKRGRDWQYGDMDKPGGEGTVKSVAWRKGYVWVRWDNGKEKDFRMGHNNAYDLMFVPGTYRPPMQK